MKKLSLLLLITVIGNCYAMEEEDTNFTLADVAGADLKNIVLSHYNSEKPDNEKNRIKTFLSEPKSYITQESDGVTVFFKVKTPELRNDLKTLIKHLPKEEKEQPDLSKLEGLQKQAQELWGTMGKYGKWGTYALGGGTLFVSGMIAGWFYTRAAIESGELGLEG